MADRISVGISVLLILHSAALVSSMAVMEATGTLIVLVGLFVALRARFFEPIEAPCFSFAKSLCGDQSSNQGVRSWTRPIYRGLDVALILFVVWGVAGLAFASVSGDVAFQMKPLRHFLWVLVLYAYFWFFSRFETASESIKGLEPQAGRMPSWLWWLFGFAAVVSVYSVAQFFTGIEIARPGREIVKPVGPFFRATGLFSLSLTFAYSFGMLAFFALGQAIVRKTADRTFWPALLLGAVISLAVFSSMTRGAWLGYVVALIFCFRLVSKRLAFAAMATSGVVAFAMVVGSDTLADKIYSILDFNNESNSLRVGLWHTHWQMFLDAPIFGQGFGLTSDLLPEYYARLGYLTDFIGHAHNNFLQVLAGMGVVGFLAFGWVQLAFLGMSFDLWRSSRRDQIWARGLGLGGLGAQIFFQIGGLTECNFIDGEVRHVLMIVWALTAVNLVKVQKKRVL